MSGSPKTNDKSPHVLSPGFENPENFCLWNPVEFWANDGNPESSEFHYKESWTQHRQYLESGSQSLESRIQNCLGSLYVGRNKKTSVSRSMVTVTSLKFQRYETKTDQKNIVPLTLELTWILNLAFLAVQKCFPVSSPRRMSFATKRGLDQAAQNLNYFNMWSKVVQYYKYVSRNNPRETRFGNGTQVKPCRSGSNWMGDQPRISS